MITAVTMLAFVAGTVFAGRRARRADVEDGARRPLEDDQYITEEIANHTRENT